MSYSEPLETETLFCATIFFMKEEYFTAETIHTVSKEMRDEAVPSGQKRARKFLPEKAALLILDMQDYFLKSDSHAFIPSAAAILPGLNSLKKSFLSHKYPVVFTQHLNTPENAGSLKTWWRDLITESHPLRGIISSLDTAGGEVLIKNQYDAFYQTELEVYLQEKKVEQILISGVMTHLCCETTARSAFIRGYDVFFLVDGTAAYHRSYHLATLRNLGHGFATLVTTEEIMREIAENDQKA